MDWTGTRGAWRGLRTAGKCLHPCLLFGTKVSKAMLGLESQSSVWDDQDIAERMRATSGVRLGERVFNECQRFLSLTWPSSGLCLFHLKTKGPAF